MGLETVTNIADFIRTNPTGADPISQGDNHIQNIKIALTNDFCGFTGAVCITGVDGGAADAYTLTPAVALPAYGTKMLTVFAPTVANTGASTMNVSGLGVKNLRSVSGAALVAGDLVVGNVYLAFYTGTEFRLTGITKNYADQLAFSTALPAQPGGATIYNLTSLAGVASWRVPSGNGGAAITSSVTLTNVSDATISVVPATPGLYATLPDATTCQEADNLFAIYNAGEYDYGVKDSTGTILGWVRARSGSVIGLADNSTAAGTWAPYGVEKTGLTATFTSPTLANMGNSLTRITVDANRTLCLFGGTSLYAIIYDASTQTWGAATLVRSGIGSGFFMGILSAANQVLVVSCTTATAIQAVTLTLAGTGVTVNAAVGAVAGGNWIETGNLVAVGTSWVFSFGENTTSTGRVRAITLAGTVPTFGAEVSVGGTSTTSPLLFVTGAVVRTVLKDVSAGLMRYLPYTVAAAVLTVGTGGTTALTDGMRAFMNGNGNIVVEYSTATHICAILKLTGTVEAISTVSIGTVPSTTGLSFSDYSVISASKTLFATINSNSCYFNILTDTAGVASAGTEVSSAIGISPSRVARSILSGNSARMAIGYSGALGQITLDVSGASASITAYVLSRFSAATFPVINAPSDRYGVRNAYHLMAGSIFTIVGDPSNGVEPVMTANAIWRRWNSVNSQVAQSSQYGGIVSDRESFIGSAFNAVGYVINRIEVAA